MAQPGWVMSTPELHLRTCFVLDDAGRIVSTREPEPARGPLFTLVRSLTSCVWAVRADVSRELASELDRLARAEPPASDLRATQFTRSNTFRCLKGKPGRCVVQVGRRLSSLSHFLDRVVS